MLQRVNDFSVTLLLHVIRVELRPAWVRQYWYDYVVERTTLSVYVCTAVVPRARNNIVVQSEIVSSH